METHGVGQGVARANLKPGYKRKAWKARSSHRRMVDLGDADEQPVETDGEGIASVNPMQIPKRFGVMYEEGLMPFFHVQNKFEILQVSDRSQGFVGFVKKQRESDRSKGFVKKQHTGRSIIDIDIPEGGGLIAGMDIRRTAEVPDDNQARAKVKVTEEKLVEIPDDIPTREMANWCTAEVPDDNQARAKAKVTEEKLGESPDEKLGEIPDEKLGEIPDDISTRERANWCTAEIPDDNQARAEVKVTEEKLGQIPDDTPTREREDWKEKLGEIPDDMATRKREDWKEKRKPQGKGEEEEEENPKPKPKRKPKKGKPKVKKLKERDRWYMDDRDQILLRALLDPELRWEEKVMDILHVVRRRGFTEYNKKMQCHVPTRFCLYNIAFFDLDKESEDVPWPPIHQIPQPLRNWLYDSVNVIAIKVAQSDRKGPISIYGTVLARDEYDYRCVYLFRHGRDDPQLITPKDRTLTLISPVRALAVRDSMFFEFHLKIKGVDAADEDFSKGFIEHSAIRHTQQPTIKSLESCLSTMELVYTPVRCALEASIAVSILKGPSDFTSKVTAWTTGNDENKLVLYDSEGAGTRTKLGPGESVCGLVAVPQGEELVLYVSLADGVQHQPEECFTLVIGPDVDERTLERGPYRMQVKISWKGVVNHKPGCELWGRPNMWGYIAGHRVLLS